MVVFGVGITGCSDDAEDPCQGRPSVYDGSKEIIGTGPAKLSDLECVAVVTGNLTIKYTDEATLKPLAKLVDVMGDLQLGDRFYPDPDGFGFESLEGLEGLQQVGGNLSIEGLGGLGSIEALQNLKRVGGDLTLTELPKLGSFKGLGSLETIHGGLDIDHIDRLVDLMTFEALHSVDGDFSLKDNPQLTSAQFPRNPRIGGDIFISSNDALTELSGFGTPVGIDQSLSVYENANVEAITLPGSESNTKYSISHNPKLQSISEDWFGSQREGDLILTHLPSLTHVKLSSWQLDRLQILSTGLATLDDFSLPLVRCSLDVRENPSLTDISALQQPASYGTSFTVTDNAALPTCKVQAIVSALLPSPWACDSTLGGGKRAVDVSGNDDTAVCP
ncbi:MAG TPA: hypothetical protein VIV60_09125 [Polyangiaceae bacterium]